MKVVIWLGGKSAKYTSADGKQVCKNRSLQDLPKAEAEALLQSGRAKLPDHVKEGEIVEDFEEFEKAAPGTEGQEAPDAA